MCELDIAVVTPDTRSALPLSFKEIRLVETQAKKALFLSTLGLCPEGLSPRESQIGHYVYVDVLKALAGEEWAQDELKMSVK